MIDEQLYSAFFDELGQIEKHRMLTKVAVNPLALGNVARTGLAMFKQPATAVSTLGKAFAGGMKAAPKGAGQLSQLGHGAKALWKTPGGRAAVLGGGAVLGAGAGGTYLAGRQAGRSSAAPGF